MLYGMANNNVIIPAERDGALYNFLLGNQDYVFEGIGDEFEITPSASSFILTLGTGEGVVCGRHVTETAGDTVLQLAQNSSGYVVIRVDLTQVAGSEAYLYATPTLQQDNLNDTGTIHDLPLYQYQTNASGVSSFVDVRNISAGSNVVCELENGQLYVYHYDDGVVTKKQVGSLDPDILTATPGDVKSGKTFGGAGSDEAQTGTFGGQSRTVTPSAYAQTVVPDEGMYLNQVNVGAITGNWSQVHSASNGNGSALSYTTTQEYKGLIVFWNNPVNVTVNKTCAYNSGTKSVNLGGFTAKVLLLLGVPSGTTITHPAYDSSTSNGFLRIYSILG